MSRSSPIPAIPSAAVARCLAGGFVRFSAQLVCMVRTDDYDADDDWDADEEFLADDEADDDDLMVCPSCGAAVHEETQQCPHCGDYITPAYPGAGRRRWVLGVIAVAVAASMLLWLVL